MLANCMVLDYEDCNRNNRNNHNDFSMEMRTSTKRTNIHSFPILHRWHWQLFICSQNVHEIPRSPLSSRLHFQPHGELLLPRTKVNTTKITNS